MNTATYGQALDRFTPDSLPPVWNEVLQTVKQNAAPPYFLVGGAITRTILNSAGGDHLKVTNYDFAVGAPKQRPELVDDWTLENNALNGWKLVSTTRGVHADVWPCCTWRTAGESSPQTIEEAIATAPLNIHAVAYDLIKGRIVYRAEYVQALAHRCIRVLCPAEHLAHCAAVGVSPEADVRYRAERFGFTYQI